MTRRTHLQLLRNPAPRRDLIVCNNVWAHRQIECEQPYRFTASLEVDGLVRVLDNRNLLILCEGRKITVALPPSVPYDDLSGHSAVLSVHGVEDLARNLATVGTEVAFDFATLDLTAVSPRVRSYD